jgi:hypothetical protein
MRLGLQVNGLQKYTSSLTASNKINILQMFFFKTKYPREINLAPDLKMFLSQKGFLGERKLGKLDLFVRNLYAFKSTNDSMPPVEWYTLRDSDGKPTEIKVKCSFAYFKIPSNFQKKIKRPNVPRKKEMKCGVHLFVSLISRFWAFEASRRTGRNTNLTSKSRSIITILTKFRSKPKKGIVPGKARAAISTTYRN